MSAIRPSVAASQGVVQTPQKMIFYDHLLSQQKAATISVLFQSVMVAGMDEVGNPFKLLQITTGGLGVEALAPSEAASWFHPQATLQARVNGPQGLDFVLLTSVPMNADPDTVVTDTIGFSAGVSVGTSGIDVDARVEGSTGRTITLPNFTIVNRSVQAFLRWEWNLTGGQTTSPLAIGVLPLTTDSIWRLPGDYDETVTMEFEVTQTLARVNNPGINWQQIVSATRQFDFSLISPPR